jgi:hypothetical protein
MEGGERMKPNTTTALGILAACLILAGCDALAGPVAGGCTLEVLDEDSRPLSTPYAVRMVTNRLGGHYATVIYTGRGWQKPVVSTTSPMGRTRSINVPAELLAEEVGVAAGEFDSPGAWRVQLNDEVAGCARDFVVLVS